VEMTREQQEAQEKMDGTRALIEQPHLKIKFQLGPVKEVGENGCQIPDVIRVVIDRLNGFNREGAPFRCRENSLAVTKLEEALHWLRHRTLEHEARGVEGKNEK